MSLNFKDAKINQETLDLAATIKLEINEAGEVSLDKDAWVNSLPADLTLAQVKAVNEHDARWVTAATVALGEQGTKFLKDNPKVDRVTVVVPRGPVGRINLVQNRVSNGINPSTKEATTTYGGISASIRTNANKNSQFKAARGVVIAHAASVLAD